MAGEEEGGRSTKKVPAQGKIKWKKFMHANDGLLKKQEPITWRQLILKNIHALA